MAGVIFAIALLLQFPRLCRRGGTRNDFLAVTSLPRQRELGKFPLSGTLFAINLADGVGLPHVEPMGVGCLNMWSNYPDAPKSGISRERTQGNSPRDIAAIDCRAALNIAPTSLHPILTLN